MRRRRAYATVAVVAISLLAGCIGPFAGGLSEEALDAEGEYDWDHPADVTATVEVGEAAVVYELDGETTSIDLSRSTLYRERPIDVEAVRFRPTDGETLTGSELDIDQGQSSTTIEVPDANGTLAVTIPAGSKSVEIPTLVDGSYAVALPPGYRVGSLLLSDVSPDADETSVVDGRQVLTWESTGADLSIQYYLARDRYVFWGMILTALLAAGLGTVYFRRKIAALAEYRRELAEEYEAE